MKAVVVSKNLLFAMGAVLLKTASASFRQNHRKTWSCDFGMLQMAINMAESPKCNHVTMGVGGGDWYLVFRLSNPICHILLTIHVEENTSQDKGNNTITPNLDLEQS